MRHRKELPSTHGSIYPQVTNMAKNKPNQPRAQQQQTAAAPAPKVAAIPQPTPSTTAITKWLLIILVGVVFVANFRTLGYEYTLDDPFFTTDNPNVSKGLSAIKEFFTHAAYYGVFQHHDASYRPLMLTSFALEKDLFNFNPHTSHLINIILFMIEIAVLFMLLKRVFKNMSEFLPFLMTLLFALHPIHTEVVASVKSRDEIMGLLFSILALWQTLRYIDNEETSAMALSALWFFCALMSKETPIAMVLIAPMTVWFFREAPVSKIVRATVPYLAVAAVYMVMRSMFIESDGEKVRILVNNNALMAATNGMDKTATALFMQLKYLIILLFPHPLSYDYSYNQVPIISFSDPRALAAVAVIIGLFVYAVRGFKKKDPLAWCILFYGMTVFITSNLVIDIGATMAERFIFTGSLAFCIAVVLLLAKLLKTDAAHATLANAKPLMGAVAVIALLYAGKTMARNEAWASNLALYKTGLETAPNSWRAQYLLGVQYTRDINTEKDPLMKRELYKDATEALNKSLQILPNNSDVYLILGYAHEFAGQLDSAVKAYTNCLTLDSLNKQAALNLGGIFLRTGRLDEGIALYSKLLARDPNDPDALANIGACYGNKGMFSEAIQYYQRSIKIRPVQPPNVFQSMSNLYKFTGDSANAQKYRALTAKAAANGTAEAY